MRRRSNLLVLLGVGFFAVGGVIVVLLTNDDDGPSGAAAAQVTVIVGTQDIPAGSLADDLIEAGSLEAIEIPASQLSPGAIQSLNQLTGAEFIQGFAANQQITASGLQLRNRTFEIPPDHEAVAVQIEFVAGGAAYVSAGDRINLYGLYATAVGDRLAPRAELLLSNVEVLDVDLTIPPRRGSGVADAGSSGSQRASGTTVTYLLALRTTDAEKVIFTTEFAALYATLTADDAPPAGPTPGRDAGNVLDD